MKYICDSCEKYPCDDTEIKLMKYCPVYSPKTQPKSNAERIRAMTDEELAELFWIRADCELCPVKELYCSDDCKKHWLDWLKQEVKEGE